jgi:hypothetical protein
LDIVGLLIKILVAWSMNGIMDQCWLFHDFFYNALYIIIYHDGNKLEFQMILVHCDCVIEQLKIMQRKFVSNYLYHFSGLIKFVSVSRELSSIGRDIAYYMQGRSLNSRRPAYSPLKDELLAIKGRLLMI